MVQGLCSPAISTIYEACQASLAGKQQLIEVLKTHWPVPAGQRPKTKPCCYGGTILCKEKKERKKRRPFVSCRRSCRTTSRQWSADLCHTPEEFQVVEAGKTRRDIIMRNLRATGFGRGCSQPADRRETEKKIRQNHARRETWMLVCHTMSAASRAAWLSLVFLGMNEDENRCYVRRPLPMAKRTIEF